MVIDYCVIPLETFLHGKIKLDDQRGVTNLEIGGVGVITVAEQCGSVSKPACMGLVGSRLLQV